MSNRTTEIKMREAMRQRRKKRINNNDDTKMNEESEIIYMNCFSPQETHIIKTHL